MGAKLNFNASTRKFEVLGPPVGGFIEIDCQVDLYSDAKEDWVSDSILAPMAFPIDAIGGNPWPTGQLGISYLIQHGWSFKPYEGDHTMRIVGNIATEGGWELVDDTIGLYRTRIENEVSALVEIREGALEATITQIGVDLSSLDTRTETIENRSTGQHATSRASGKLIIRDTVNLRRWEANAWEDEARTIAYGTNANAGIEVVDDLVEVAWS